MEQSKEDIILQQKIETIRVLTGIIQMGVSREETKPLYKVANDKQIEIIKSIKFD